MSELAYEEGITFDDPPTATVGKKVRVQLDFEQADMRIINDLVTELDLGTRAELFRSALRSLRWMVQKKRQRNSVVAITPDGRYLEPEFDFLARFSTADVPTTANQRTPVQQGTFAGPQANPVFAVKREANA